MLYPEFKDWQMIADDHLVDFATFGMKIARSENLPVLPQVVSSVLKMADDPNGSPKAMEKLVERDPALTAKILRVANSAAYSAGQISSIGRALSVLGMNTVRSLVVAVAFQQIISGKQISVKFNKLDYWRHSLAAATAARILGKLKMPLKAEELYCAALMHDVGYLVLEKFAPELLDEALITANSTGIPVHEAERQKRDFDHAQLGGLLAEKWGLHGLIEHAVKYHHDVQSDPEHSKTTAFVAAANVLAQECGFTNQTKNSMELTRELMDMIELPAEQVPAIRGAIASEVEKAIFAFQIK